MIILYAGSDDAKIVMILEGIQVRYNLIVRSKSFEPSTCHMLSILRLPSSAHLQQSLSADAADGWWMRQRREMDSIHITDEENNSNFVVENKKEPTSTVTRSLATQEELRSSDGDIINESGVVSHLVT